MEILRGVRWRRRLDRESVGGNRNGCSVQVVEVVVVIVVEVVVVVVVIIVPL